LGKKSLSRASKHRDNPVLDIPDLPIKDDGSKPEVAATSTLGELPSHRPVVA
jgi:hypothetical protein